MTDGLPQRLQQALADRYRIERELGGGGMSRVFVAREIALGRDVVIKVLASAFAEGVSAERFGREIQLAASLQQANIVPLLAAGSADGIAYYAMPYVPGESLRGRLSQGGPPPIAECISILRDVARALSYAHARGVVHRDIKPDNVLLSHGAAMVTDFGIAKAVSASRTLAGGGTLTQAGTSLGTPAYMSPEQVGGDPDVDHRADLYAWGCLACEVLTGAPPFVYDAPQRTLAAHISETPTPLATRRADVPASLDRLVLRCLAKDPMERPESADALLRELDAAFTPGAGDAASVRSTRFGGRAAGAIASVAAVVVLVGAQLLWRGRSAASGDGASSDRSIAVLPMTAVGGDKTADAFGIGLAEELTGALAQAGVRVIGRTGASALAARGLDGRAIAKELGVGSLLSGTLQFAGDKVRIAVTLSAADGAVRWTRSYDRPITNIFAVQDEIARAVSTELLGALGAPKGTLVRTETDDPEAHSLLLQGIVLWNRRTSPDIRQAIHLFDRAIARDPRYARAHAWRAMGAVTLSWYDNAPTDSLLGVAIASAERAIDLDSTVAEAFTASAYALGVSNRNREAEARFAEAMRLDSTLATTHFWWGLQALHVGDFAKAHRRIARARELEPISQVIRSGEAQVYVGERKFAAADSLMRQALLLDSTYALVHLTRAWAQFGLGRWDDGIASLRRLVGKPGPRQWQVLGALSWGLVRSGHAAEARAILADAERANGGRMPPVGLFAATLDELGDTPRALRVLHDALESSDPWMWQGLPTEPFDHLRKDPAARKMLDSAVAR